jgi:hypothetical protein
MNTQPNNGLEAIIAKVKKLLAFANDGRGNEAEMANAAELAQKMIEDYNLSMATIEAAGGKTDNTREKAIHEERAQYKWMQTLMTGIASLHFCHLAKRTAWRDGKTVFTGYQLIGRKANVATATMMYDYLTGAIDRVVRIELVDPRQLQSKVANSMRTGMTDRLCERLQAKRDEEIKASKARAEAEKARHTASPSTANAVAIVLSDFIQDEMDANTDFRNNWEPGTSKRQRMEGDARRAARDQKIKDLMAQGKSYDVAWDMAFSGMSEADAEKKNKPQTEAQKAKDEAKWKRYWERQERQRQREAEKFDGHAYHAGRRLGDEIGLDVQVAKGTKHSIG